MIVSFETTMGLVGLALMSFLGRGDRYMLAFEFVLFSFVVLTIISFNPATALHF